jgi:hypothetical protein
MRQFIKYNRFSLLGTAMYAIGRLMLMGNLGFKYSLADLGFDAFAVLVIFTYNRINQG